MNDKRGQALVYLMKYMLKGKNQVKGNVSLKKIKIITKLMRGRLNVNKKGQALVEFVIILPIFILLVLGVIDIGRIMYTKMNLEEQMSDIVDYYKNGKTIQEIKDKLGNEIKIDKDNEYVNILVTKEIDIITPGLQMVFDNPYVVKVERSILNE